MLTIAQISETTGASRADIVRVLRGQSSGTTETDWRIAHAIEAAGGRNAHELMMLAGRDAEVARIWADSRDDTNPTAPTNPRAVHDPTVTIYPENTSPDETRQIAPHHPGDQADDIEDDQEQDDQAAAHTLADTLFADLAEVTDSLATARLATGWQTPDETRRAVRAVLLTHPATTRRARYRARLQRHLATAA